MNSGDPRFHSNPGPDPARKDGGPRATGNGAGRKAHRPDGKVALVVGGHRALGRSVARGLAREGADVAVLYFDEHRDAIETRALITREGRRCLLMAGDVRNPAFYDLAVDQLVQEWGRLDIVVGGAPEHRLSAGVESLRDDLLRDLFSLSVFSMFYLTRAALPHLEPGATIIASAPVGGGAPGSVGAAATAGAILSFTRSMAGVLKTRGIRVNAVALDAGRPPPRTAPFQGRLDALAYGYVFLALHAPESLTGHVVHMGSAAVERA